MWGGNEGDGRIFFVFFINDGCAKRNWGLWPGGSRPHVKVSPLIVVEHEIQVVDSI